MGLYRTKTVNGRKVSYHRWVWEQAHGPIPPGMIVHHVDGDRRNNDLGNLRLMTHAEHARLHNDRHPRAKVCAACGAAFTPAPTKRASAKTCSRDCLRSHMRAVARRTRGNAKLTLEQVAEIRALIGTMPQKAIAERYGVSPPTITRIKQGPPPDA